MLFWPGKCLRREEWGWAFVVQCVSHWYNDRWHPEQGWGWLDTAGWPFRVIWRRFPVESELWCLVGRLTCISQLGGCKREFWTISHWVILSALKAFNKSVLRWFSSQSLAFMRRTHWRNYICWSFWKYVKSSHSEKKSKRKQWLQE